MSNFHLNIYIYFHRAVAIKGGFVSRNAVSTKVQPSRLARLSVIWHYAKLVTKLEIWEGSVCSKPFDNLRKYKV